MIVKEKITKEDLVAQAPEGLFIKLVVDIEKEIMAIGCLYHSECADELSNEGSSSKNLWGANFYPDDNRIEFFSLINIKPPIHRSMEIQDESIKKKVEIVIKKLLAQ